MNEINYDDIKNDLADLGFSDDAGELTERAEASFWSQVDVNQSEQDYFISLDYPYTEEIHQPLPVILMRRISHPANFIRLYFLLFRLKYHYDSIIQKILIGSLIIITMMADAWKFVLAPKDTAKMS